MPPHRNRTQRHSKGPKTKHKSDRTQRHSKGQKTKHKSDRKVHLLDHHHVACPSNEECRLLDFRALQLCGQLPVQIWSSVPVHNRPRQEWNCVTPHTHESVTERKTVGKCCFVFVFAQRVAQHESRTRQQQWFLPELNNGTFQHFSSHFPIHIQTTQQTDRQTDSQEMVPKYPQRTSSGMLQIRLL